MIKAGLIGEKLGHSMSGAIHEKFYETASVQGSYELFETSKDELGTLIEKLEKDGFAGLNVTIPYKTEVMQYLDEISQEAAEIGAVNTILFKNAKRYGHNTDYYGLKTLLEANDVQVENKRIVILGSGGAAKCALKLALDMGASERIVASRNPANADVSLCATDYESLSELESIDVLINTTPAGMSPNVDICPVGDSVIQKSGSVVDLIYNPEHTLLLRKASSYGKTGVNGLLMLVAQAIKAQEIWNEQNFEQSTYERIFSYIQSTVYPKKSSIVLIGMPGSGKTSIGKKLAEQLGMDFVDTDSLVEEEHGSIPTIFEEKGESVFREYERHAAQKASTLSNVVISTGGGIILDERNMTTLGQSGTIVFLDRPLEKLLDDIEIDGRPLLKDGEFALVALQKQRESLYRKYAEITADNSADMAHCVADIMKKIEEIRI